MIFKKQMISAHRGASGYIHENTIAAFIEAINLGADAIEFDVRKSGDGIFIISHDDNLNGQKLSQLNYQDIIKISQAQSFIIPTLEEVLQQCKGKIFMDIELKEEGDEEKIIELIKKYLSYDQFFIRSFSDCQLRKVKKIDSQIKTGLLLGVSNPRFGIFTRLSELFPFLRIKLTRADFVSPHYRLMKFNYTKRMHRLKKPVIVWTVNDEELIKTFLIKYQVDGLITDYPDKAIAILKKSQN